MKTNVIGGIKQHFQMSCGGDLDVGIWRGNGQFWNAVGNAADLILLQIAIVESTPIFEVEDIGITARFSNCEFSADVALVGADLQLPHRLVLDLQCGRLQLHIGPALDENLSSDQAGHVCCSRCQLLRWASGVSRRHEPNREALDLWQGQNGQLTPPHIAVVTTHSSKLQIAGD